MGEIEKPRADRSELRMVGRAMIANEVSADRNRASERVDEVQIIRLRRGAGSLGAGSGQAKPQSNMPFAKV